MPRKVLSGAQFAAIERDTRSALDVARDYGISVDYAAGIQKGHYHRKVLEAPPRVARPDRFYRPFRDGTYS